MTIKEIKGFIYRLYPDFGELAQLVRDHDRLERENAELRAALLETATQAGVVEQVEEARCHVRKAGESHTWRCIHREGHEGDHNYSVEMP